MLEKQITNILRDTLGNPKEFVPLHEPSFSGDEMRNVQDCISSGWVSSVGKYVDQFEIDLARFCGTERAIATVNGTSALHVALILAKVEADTEVITPSLTFVATANAISYCNAIPHFVDVEERTLGLDPEKLEEHLTAVAVRDQSGCLNHQTGRRISALLPMHAFGHPVSMDELMKVAEKWGIPVVEDAAESLGSFYKEKHTGNRGLVSAVSFNGNKILTTGGGGAILTNDVELASRAKHLTTTAKVPHPWAYEHDEVGFNYRMPNLNAALGVAQLANLTKHLRAKRQLALRYRDAFSDLRGVRFFEEPTDCASNYWLNTLVLAKDKVSEFESILEATNGSGIMTRPVWNPLHSLNIYKGSPSSDLSVTDSLSGRILNIPSSAKLAHE